MVDTIQYTQMKTLTVYFRLMFFVIWKKKELSVSYITYSILQQEMVLLLHLQKHLLMNSLRNW